MGEEPGSVSGAYFVGKRQLLEWVNDFLDLNFTKVEQMHTGWAHCQLVDALFPGQVNMSKVNFNAKTEYEFVRNFKVIQEVFAKNSIKKPIPVDKMVKGRYQSNFEFLQWMKSFFDGRYDGQEYNAAQRRAGKIQEAKKPRRISDGKGAAESKIARKSLSRMPVPTSTKKSPQAPKSYGKAKQLETQLSTITEEMETLQKSMEEKDAARMAEIEELQKQMKEMSDGKDAALDDVKKLQEQIEGMVTKEDHGKIVSEKDVAEKEKKELQDQLEVVKSTQSEGEKALQEKLSSALSELETNKSGKENAEAEIKMLKGEVDDLKHKLKAKEQDIENMRKKLVEVESAIKNSQDTLKLFEPLSWWAVSNTPPDNKDLRVLKLALVSMDEKTSNEDTHIVISVVDDQGKVVGRSARTPPGALKAPVYILVGEKGEQDPPLYLFLQVKYAKRKKAGLKMSELGFGFTELDPLVNWLHKSVKNPLELQTYKKPTDFTRDPTVIKKNGRNTLTVAFNLLGPEPKKD
mmetsp:Transcript_32411/g.63345  ORF Transcript_32411/g.63345 Transcript_32411/m.63345 type:complete len:518 (+) Transcript_32411:19-1572(+)